MCKSVAAIRTVWCANPADVRVLYEYFGSVPLCSCFGRVSGTSQPMGNHHQLVSLAVSSTGATRL